MRYVVIAVTKDKYGIRTHGPVGEFEQYAEAADTCRMYRDTMKMDYIDAYILRIDPNYPLFIPPHS